MATRWSTCGESASRGGVSPAGVVEQVLRRQGIVCLVAAGLLGLGGVGSLIAIRNQAGETMASLDHESWAKSQIPDGACSSQEMAEPAVGDGLHVLPIDGAIAEACDEKSAAPPTFRYIMIARCSEIRPFIPRGTDLRSVTSHGERFMLGVTPGASDQKIFLCLEGS